MINAWNSTQKIPRTTCRCRQRKILRFCNWSGFHGNECFSFLRVEIGWAERSSRWLISNSHHKLTTDIVKNISCITVTTPNRIKTNDEKQTKRIKWGKKIKNFCAAQSDFFVEQGSRLCACLLFVNNGSSWLMVHATRSVESTQRMKYYKSSVSPRRWHQRTSPHWKRIDAK